MCSDATTQRPAAFSSSSTRRTASCTSGSFTSSSTGTAGKLHNTSASVGIRMPVPRKGRVRPRSVVNQRPASPARSSASVRARTGPVRLVVRSSVASCRTTAAPSRVSRTSSSNASAPCSSASSNAGSVFSGACADAPRWAMIG